MMDYEIEIYKENDNYYAEIAMDGQTTLVRAKAKVDGEEEFISLRFLKYLPDHGVGLCSEINDVLISFKKENGDIYTYWGEIGPMLYINDESGNVYFEKGLPLPHCLSVQKDFLLPEWYSFLLTDPPHTLPVWRRKEYRKKQRHRRAYRECSPDGCR